METVDLIPKVLDVPVSHAPANPTQKRIEANFIAKPASGIVTELGYFQRPEPDWEALKLQKQRGAGFSGRRLTVGMAL